MNTLEASTTTKTSFQKYFLAHLLYFFQSHLQSYKVCQDVNMLTKFLSILLVLSAVESFEGKFDRTNSRFKRYSNEQCGVPTQSTSLIIGGSTFQRGTWPWMVALMQKNISPPKLFCGGVLVSKTKVLTGEKSY